LTGACNWPLLFAKYLSTPFPRSTASWVVRFSAAQRLVIFLLQLVTGILLALIYVPSASEAWSSPADAKPWT